MRRLLIWIQKPQNGIIIDRRVVSSCVVWGMATMAIVCFLAAIALAANTGPESLNEHGVIVMQGMWWVIGGLFSVAALSLAFIYQSGRKSDREKFGVLFTKIDGIHEKMDGWKDHVLTKTTHDQIDHSQLCPVCRTVKLEIKA